MQKGGVRLNPGGSSLTRGQREEQDETEPRQPVLGEETLRMVSRLLSTEMFCWKVVHKEARK